MRHADTLLLRFTDDELEAGLEAMGALDPESLLEPATLGLLAFGRPATAARQAPSWSKQAWMMETWRPDALPRVADGVVVDHAAGVGGDARATVVHTSARRIGSSSAASSG